MSESKPDIQGLRDQVEAHKLKLEEANLQRQLKLVENSSIYGEPVDFERLFRIEDRPLMPVWTADNKKERFQTIRTLSDLHFARNRSTQLHETNPNAAAIVRGLKAYAVGCGATVTPISADEDDEPPKQLTKKVKLFLKKFRRANQMEVLELEMVERYVVHGEYFWRLYPDEDNVTKVRAVEPAQVRPPQGENHEGPWSWGVLTPHGDAMRPDAYGVHDFDTVTDEVVEAQFIVHGKFNCTSSQKRGIPEFYASDDELRGTAKLRYATREGEKIRACIAYFREWEGPMSGPQSLQGAAETGTLQRTNQNGTQRDVSVQEIEPGNVQDVPKGMQVKPPPASPNSIAAAEACRMGVQAAAARSQVPEWLASGEADVSNFAASLTTEAPFTKSLELRQADLKRTIYEIHYRAIEIGVEQGELPENTLEELDLQVELPRPEVREVKAEIDGALSLYNAGLTSAHTTLAKLDYDPETETANLRQEAEDRLTNPIPPPPHLALKPTAPAQN